jgi:hypothetical protein
MISELSKLCIVLLKNMVDNRLIDIDASVGRAILRKVAEI